MPFWNQIANFINDTLQAGSLNESSLNPQRFYGLATTIVRKRDPSSKTTEQLPGIIPANGNDVAITPDDSQALQIYHRLERSSYNPDKLSGYGDNFTMVDSSDMYMVVLTNSKLTGITKEVLEPVVRFGIPQKLSSALISSLKIRTGFIRPVSSNMNHVEVFRGEYPQNDYFLNQQMSIFLIRYRFEMTYNPSCINPKL